MALSRLSIGSFGKFSNADKANDEEQVEDTYKLFTKELEAKASTQQDSRSRNVPANTVVKHYTDDIAILDDKVFFESFDEHYEKHNLGQRYADSSNLDSIITKVDNRNTRKGSVMNRFGSSFGNASKAVGAFIMKQPTKNMQT